MVEANPSSREYVIGIDLGTTNSCVGFFDEDTGQVEIIPNSMGKRITPSWIGFNDDGRIVVGKSAKNQELWVYDAKRMIGNKFDDKEVTPHLNRWGFTVKQGPKKRCQIVRSVEGQE